MQIIKALSAALLIVLTAGSASAQEDGSRGAFNPRQNGSYGNNILSLAVLQMTNESVAGIGLHYERMLDPKGILSFYLPLAISFVPNNEYYYAPSGPARHDRTAFFSAFPGLKIYPTGSQGIVRYSVGPSLAIAAGERWFDHSVYNPNTGQYTYIYSKESLLKAGVIVNNGINIQPMKNLYLGLELGLGFYYFNEENDYNNSWSGEPMVQFNFKMGYRF